ncbi:MAG TPA: undecaprenyl-diphosphate phosphatase [Chloroflexota bacterium]
MTIDLWQAVVMGVVQGFTEFLPISSSGHLILVPALLGWQDSPVDQLEFTVALHGGTLIALLAVFWRDWVELIGAALRSLGRRSLKVPNSRLAWLLVLGTLPGAIAGALFEKKIEDALRAPLVVGITMAGVALVLAAADIWSRKNQDEHSLGATGAFGIGCAQALALVPGVSRSGITISAGLGLGLTRSAAARFSFLLSAPIVAGALVKEGYDVVRAGLPPGEAVGFAVGVLAAAISGFIAIRWLLRYLARGSLMPFVAYRLIVGGIVIVLALAGRI